MIIAADVELRPIPGYDGLYSVTANGRVWSHAKTTRRGRITFQKHLGMWLKPNVLKCGYAYVLLSRATIKKHMLVHRAVALAWISNASGLPEVNHMNGDKLDNKHTNLEWCTGSQNKKHAYDTGLRAPTQKISDACQRVGKARRVLTLEQAGEIRKRRSDGERIKDIAAAYNVDRVTVSQICRNRTYIS